MFKKTKIRSTSWTPRLEVLEDRCLLTTALAEFPVTSGSAPFALVSGPDGNMWFTENQAGKIGMINPTTHAVSEFALPSSGNPTGITVGPDGNLWFTESSANKIGMINPTSHAISEFDVSTANAQPNAIVAGPDGNLWFTESATDLIGMINPTTHAVTEFPIPSASASPDGIAAGVDGNLWFTENSNNKIASLNPITHVFAEYALPTAGSQPFAVVSNVDGNIWFTENHANKIARINETTHAITELAIPSAGSNPVGIAVGPDGNIWFTEFNTNKLGMISLPTNVITESAILTANSSPIGIASGPGGTLWFTESSADQIGEAVAAPVITTQPVNVTITEGQTATFTAVAGIGLPTPTVQWQLSIDGGVTFAPLINAGVYSGVNTTTLAITGAIASMNGFKFEAVFGNGIGAPVVSSAATLTVKPVLSLAPAAPPQGIVGVSYNQTLSITGSTTPFTVFAVQNFNAGGTGLTVTNITTSLFNGTVAISGTPTSAGAMTFTLSVANTAGDTLTKSLTVTIRPPLSIATPSLPDGTAGAKYSQTIAVLGGALPYTTFNVTGFSAGTTGLTSSAISIVPATGKFVINATPLAGGNVTFTVNIADSMGSTLTKTYTIHINPALAMTPSLPAGTAGTLYQHSINVSGGGVPYTSLTITSFSAGTTGLTPGAFTANAGLGTIAINATPLAAGSFTFTAKVVDAIGAVLSKTYTVAINKALVVTSSLPQATVGKLYHQVVAVTSGTLPYTTFTVTGFSGGATGLTAAAITASPLTGAVVVNGTPTGAGSFAFTLNVMDAAGSALTRSYIVAVNLAPSLGSLTTTQWTVGKAGFTGVLAITGGTAPYALASATGTPTGMTVLVSGNNVFFSGAPTAAGSFAAGSVTIRDAAGATATRTFGIAINAPLAVSALSAAQWTLGQSGFGGTMKVTGGTGGLAIVAATGLPTGLSIGLTGSTLAFTGTPTAVHAFTGSVTLRDAVGAIVTRTFTITINAAPTVGNLTLAQWTANKAGFTGALSITGGTGPFTITSAAGLPTGLSAVMNGNTIRFIGTPTVAGAFTSASITVRDATGAMVMKTFTITIHPPLKITTLSFPPTPMAVFYTTAAATSGGTGPIKFALTAGSLPPGMTLSSTGVISGATRGFGSFTFTLTATDAAGATFSKQYTLTVSRSF